MAEPKVTTTLAQDPLPLSRDSQGVVRVGGTRVSLDSLLHLYRQGATAEEIATSFPDVELPDIYTAIAYYLRHREEVDRYVESRRREAQKMEHEIRRRFPTAELRERLLARRREDAR